MDADIVSPPTSVRQPFGSADIGQNKATVLIIASILFQRPLMASDETFFTKDAEQHRQQLRQ